MISVVINRQPNTDVLKLEVSHEAEDFVSISQRKTNIEVTVFVHNPADLRQIGLDILNGAAALDQDTEDTN